MIYACYCEQMNLETMTMDSAMNERGISRNPTFLDLRF